MDTKYFLVEGGDSTGPFTFEELKAKGVSKDSMVWYEGLSTWTRADEIPALAPIFAPAPPTPQPQTPEVPVTPQTPEVPQVKYYAMVSGNRIGPMTVNELIRNGVTPQTMVWCEGLNDWVAASSRQDFMMAYNAGQPPVNPVYNPNPQYVQQPAYNQPVYGQNIAPRESMKGMAIAATVCGALFSCIGLIFGIIAITNANKAQKAYDAGDDFTAASYNKAAKTNSIVAFVLAGIGLLFSIIIAAAG